MDSRQDEPFYGSVDASADPKNRVGECLHQLQFWVGGGLHRLCLLGRWRPPPTLVFGSVDASSDSSLESVEASTDSKNIFWVSGCIHQLKNRVGGGLHRLLTRVGGCIHRPKNESWWRPPATQKTESVEACGDPRNTIHPADCPMID